MLSLSASGCRVATTRSARRIRVLAEGRGGWIDDRGHRARTKNRTAMSRLRRVDVAR